MQTFLSVMRTIFFWAGIAAVGLHSFEESIKGILLGFGIAIYITLIKRELK